MFHPTNNIGVKSSGFGMRASGFHGGFDIAVPAGTPVYAFDSGYVVKIEDDCVDGNFNCGLMFGNHVAIDHRNDIFTNYAHLSKTVVKVGQKVKAGQLIGYSGNTGLSTGGHLHFEIRQGGWLSETKLDPEPYLNGQKTLPKSMSLYNAKHTPKYILLGASVLLVAYSIYEINKGFNK